MPDPENLDLDELINNAVNKAVEAVSKPEEPAPEPEPASAPEPPPAVDYNELFAEGRYDEAVAAMKQEALREAGKLAGPALYAAHENAKQLAREKLGERFEKWADKAVELAKQYNIDPHAWVTVEDWERAIKHAMAQNIDEVIAEERERARRDALAAVAAGSVAGGSVGTAGSDPDAWAKLSEEAREVVQRMGWDADTVAKHWDLIEKHSAPDGAIVELTVMDEDIEFNEKGVPTEIEPGRF